MIVIRLSGRSEAEINAAAAEITASPVLAVESDSGVQRGRRELLRYIYATVHTPAQAEAVKTVADPENRQPSKRRRP